MNPIDANNPLKRLDDSKRKRGPEPPRKKKYKPPKDDEPILPLFSIDLPQNAPQLTKQFVSYPRQVTEVKTTAIRILDPTYNELSMLYEELEINAYEKLEAAVSSLKKFKMCDKGYQKSYLRAIDIALSWLYSEKNIESEDPKGVELIIILLAKISKVENIQLRYEIVIKCLLHSFDKAEFCLNTFGINNCSMDFATYCSKKNFFLAIKTLPLLNLSQDCLARLKKICTANTPIFLKSLVAFYESNFLEASVSLPYDYKVNLNSLPNLPVRPNPVDISKLNNWINKHSLNMQPIAKFLGENIKHISMNTFIEKLRISINLINNHLKDSSYCFIVDTFKSTQWLVELSLPNISPASKPKEIFTLNSYIDYLIKYYKNFDPKDKLINKVVILDDGIYSGEQISEYLTAVAEAIKDLQDVYPEVELPEIFIFPIYSTRFGVETIEEVAKELNLHDLHVFKNQHIKTYSEIIDELDLQAVDQLLATLRCQFQELFWFFNKISNMSESIFNEYLAYVIDLRDTQDLSVKDQKDPLIIFLKSVNHNFNLYLFKDPKQQLLYLLNEIFYCKENEDYSLHLKGFSSRGNIYFDFKIPDEYSFPYFFTTGAVLSHRGELTGQKEFFLHNVPPYKHNFARFKEIVESGNT